MENVVYFMNIWNILWPFGIIFGRLVKFVAISYIFPILVCLAQEKSVMIGPNEVDILEVAPM
jgi:hypothetical protein